MKEAAPERFTFSTSSRLEIPQTMDTVHRSFPSWAMTAFTREQIFAFIKQLRAAYPEVPLIDMTLYDTAATMGQGRFLQLSAEADVDGFDLPNYPLIRTGDRFGLYQYCLEHDRRLILAISYELATAPEGTPEYEMLSEMARRARASPL